MALGIIGIAVALFLFIYLTYRGWATIWVAIGCAVIVALTNAIPVQEAMTGIYPGGIIELLPSMFFVICFGAMLGKIFNDSGAATSIAVGLIKVLVNNKEGKQKIFFSFLTMEIVYIICMFGGLDAYILMFTCLPIAIAIARNANIPRRFIPAMLLSGGMIMGAPAVPQINNIIMLAAFEQNGMPVPLTAGFGPGWIGAIVGIILQLVIYYKLANKAIANGEVWEEGGFEKVGIADRPRPNFVVAIIPLIVVFVLYSLLQLNIFFALGGGILAALLLLHRYIPSREERKPLAIDFGRSTVQTLNDGATGFPVPFIQVTTPAALAAVIMATPVFGALVGGLAGIHISPILFALIAGYILVAITASPPATLMIIAPIVAGVVGQAGADPATVALVARAATVASTTFCLLPYDGVIVLSNSLARVPMKKGYGPMFLGALIPCVIASVIVGLLLFAVA